MTGKADLKEGRFYEVQGEGNDIFKTGEKVLLALKDEHSYVFRQGSIDIVINEAGIDRFLHSMAFKLLD